EEDFRFSVLDNSDPTDPDFFFVPLVFLESFNSPAIVMEINGNEILMPIAASISYVAGARPFNSGQMLTTH
ncbi:MAG: hypothetical protein ACO35F_03645, partial [Ilumatobacteraceae bacterium]